MLNTFALAIEGKTEYHFFNLKIKETMLKRNPISERNIQLGRKKEIDILLTRTRI